MVHANEMIGFKEVLSIHAMNSRMLKSLPDGRICGRWISAWGENMVGLHYKATDWVMELEDLEERVKKWLRGSVNR